MAKPKRNSLERERDLEAVKNLYLRGMYQADIARQLGVTQQQVSYDLKIIQTRWAEKTAIDFDLEKQKELSRIDTVEREYWEAWERSKGEKVKARQETNGRDKSGKPMVSKAVSEKEQMIGNPQFLQGVQWCITERCKLLGLVAPAKLDANVNSKATLENRGEVKLIVEYVDDPDVE